MQTRYWSNYLDVEQKLFDETCVLHAREFAHKCVVQFFEEMREDVSVYLPPPFVAGHCFEEWEDAEKEKLHGITRQEQMDELLSKWYYSKPKLDVTWEAQRSRAWVSWRKHRGKVKYSDV